MIPVTNKTIELLLKDGNYTRAASLAVKLSDDPLVAMLARELAAVGNKNRNGRGPRRSDRVEVVGVAGNSGTMTPDELCAALLYDELKLARMIVDGKVQDGDATAARALLRKHKLHKIEKWQQFPARARTEAANCYGVAEEKIPR